jgi:hypothetical protein
MTSITHLPVELTLNIIEYLRPHVPYMDTDEALMRQATIVKRSCSDTGFEIFDDPEEGEDNRGRLLAEENKQRSELRHSDLGSLRQ